MKLPRWMWLWIVLGWVATLAVAIVDRARIDRLERELKATKAARP